MRRCGEMNSFFVMITIAIVPFYSLSLDHNTTSKNHEIAHDQINITNVNSSSSNQSHTNVSSPHSTNDLSGEKVLLPSSEQKPNPVTSNSSSATNKSSDDARVHHLKADHSKGQVMEGGGSLPIKKTAKTPETGLVNHQNSTAETLDVPKTSSALHKNISPRKGAPMELLKDAHPLEEKNSSTTTPKPTTKRKLKPMYTMVKGDKFTKESESFIESPTTGKDYVLPMVLIIFAVPAFIFLVKFLYKRGTEFTERQQYHRMYLIDGDNRTPIFKRWGMFMKYLFWPETLQTVNLTNFGGVSSNPRMNYHSF